MKKIIYTVNLGNYDKPKPAPKFRGWQTAIFTDDKNFKGDYDFVYFVDNRGLDLKKESRRYKWLPHIYLKGFDLYCYIDASMTLKIAPPNEPFFVKHPNRKTIISEANKIIELKKADKDKVVKQVAKYYQSGFKDNYGLFQNGFFVAQNNQKLMETVFKEVENNTHRDQLAFPYVLWKLGIIGINTISAIESKRYIKINQHINESTPHHTGIK